MNSVANRGEVAAMYTGFVFGDWDAAHGYQEFAAKRLANLTTSSHTT